MPKYWLIVKDNDIYHAYRVEEEYLEKAIRNLKDKEYYLATEVKRINLKNRGNPDPSIIEIWGR